MCIKGGGRSTQATFYQTGFFSPVCRRYAEQSDRANPFIQPLFWCPTPLLEKMIVVGSFPAFSPGLWHTSNSKMEAKEARLGGILCHLDYLAGMLLEKTDHDNDLLTK